MTAAARKASSWFEVDKEGLAKLVDRRGKAFVIFELIQNAWDAPGARRVSVDLEYLGRERAKLMVADDSPNGFKDLTHAFTLFAPSEKKGDPKTRGRFNLGEKLVLAICDRATITSTKGQVSFEKDGRRTTTSRARVRGGSVFEAVVRMTANEMKDVLADAFKLLPPPAIITTVNGVALQSRVPVRALHEIFLQTDVADAAGHMRRKYNDADVDLHIVKVGERPTLYEMGIPVVELGDDPFHLNVRQKVPLSMERDGVPPSYLRDVRAAVLDHAYDLISAKAATGRWSQDAIEASENPKAVAAIVAKRFGDKVVIADPSDQEGTQMAAARGYVVIPGGAFTGDAWDKIREAKAALPAGQVTPSPKPFHPDGESLAYVMEDDLTDDVKSFRSLVVDFAERIADLDATVLFTDDGKWNFKAAYQRAGDAAGTVIFNLAKLDEDFWVNDARKMKLVVHELGHHWGGHLDEAYHDAICRMAGRAIATGWRP